MKKSEKLLEILALCFLLIYLATIINGSWEERETKLFDVTLVLLALAPILVTYFLMRERKELILEVLAIYSSLVILYSTIGIFSIIGVGEISVRANVYTGIIALLAFAPVLVTCVLILAYLRRIKKRKMEISLGGLAIYSLLISLNDIIQHFSIIGKTIKVPTLPQAIGALLMFASVIARGILTPIYLRKFRPSSAL
jgi:hypothetical protein